MRTTLGLNLRRPQETESFKITSLLFSSQLSSQAFTVDAATCIERMVLDNYLLSLLLFLLFTLFMTRCGQSL